MKDPTLLLCGVFCLYPLVLFGLPAFLVGRYWGRVRFKSPIELTPEERQLTPGVLRPVARAAPPRDPVGYGSNKP